MATHKHPRKRGKISLRKYFQAFKEGEKVAVVTELSQPFGYSKRLQGRTGTIVEKRGDSYKIELSDLGKPKIYFIHPIHLKKIEVQTP